MGLSGDEERILAKIENHLVHDDPLFARRAATLQRRIRRREILFYETLCMLIIIVGSLITVALVVTAGRSDATDPLRTPVHQISADEDKATVLESPTDG